jgi:peptide/nickel transport system substrate-binding protein
VRQQDLESLKKSHPKLVYKDFVSNVTGAIYMRTDQPPFNDVRVRRAISLAIDRQGIIDGLGTRGQPTPAIAPGLTEWSLPIDQLGAGAKYYQPNPQEAKRLLAEAGFAKGFKTQLYATPGYGRDLIDAVQLVQQYLKDVGIEVELKLQEYGAYMATTFVGKYEGMAMGPISIAWEPDSVLYAMYVPNHPRNSSHVDDPKLLAMLQEQRRTKDREGRKKLIFDIQRYIADQQYYVFINSGTITGTWQPYVKNYTPNLTFDYGSRTAVLWLDR